MSSFSATDFAIRCAHAEGTLRITPRWSSRFLEEYLAIEDDCGLIEVALSEDAALARLDGILGLEAAAEVMQARATR